MADTVITNNLNFKFGEVSKLPSQISNGTIYVTTDERALHVDLDGSRIRLGNVVFYDTLKQMTEDEKNWYKNTLAYVANGNVLACWNGTDWVQVNDVKTIEANITKLQTDLAAETTNREEAVTALNKTISDERDRATTKEAALEARIKANEDNIGTKKSTSTLTLWETVETLAGDSFESLEGLDGKIAKEIEDRIAADNALNGLITTNREDIDAINNPTNGILTTAKGYTDTEIGKLDTALKGSVENDTKNSPTIEGAKKYADAINTALSGQITSTNEALGALSNVAETKTDAISKLEAAKKYSDDNLKTAKEYSDNNLKAAKEYSDGKLKTFSDSQNEINTDYATRIGNIETFFDVDADQEGFYDTLEEIRDYLNSDETAANLMLGNLNVLKDVVSDTLITKNDNGSITLKQDIPDYVQSVVSASAETLNASISAVNDKAVANREDIDAINNPTNGILTTAKGYTDTEIGKLDTALKGNSTTDSKASPTIEGAKKYADAVGADAVTSANAYAEQKATAAQSAAEATAKGYTDTQATAAQSAAEATAKGYTDAQATVTLTDAKAYTDNKVAKLISIEKGVKLQNTANDTLGQITFFADPNNTSLNVTTTAGTGASANSHNVNISLVWGRF